MNGLTTALLDRACRIFLELAYPEGIETISTPISAYLFLRPELPPQAFLTPPVCQRLSGRSGYVLRLGSESHPHLKLTIVGHDDTECVFTVDTHDAIDLASRSEDAGRWARFRTANRQLKNRIERAWEDAGLLTFNALLRRELETRI
jgi:hypothetical protein